MPCWHWDRGEVLLEGLYARRVAKQLSVVRLDSPADERLATGSGTRSRCDGDGLMVSLFRDKINLIKASGFDAVMSPL